MIRKKWNAEEVIGLLLFAICIFCLGDLFRLCFSNDIWYDELFSVGMVQHTYIEIAGFTARDVHPPLYYFIIKAVTDLVQLVIPTMDRVILCKIASLIPYPLLLFYALVFIRRNFGMLSAGLFSFCMFCMPQMTAFTVEIRMYSWALFFVTAAFLHLYELLLHNRKKDWIFFFLYGIFAAYTHYFACIAVVFLYFTLLVWIVLNKREALKNWIVCVILSVLAYLPWLLVLLKQISQVKSSYWIQPLTFRSIAGCVKYALLPAGGNVYLNYILALLLFLLYAFFFLRFLTGTAKVEQKWFAVGALLTLCLTVGMGFILSALIRPIFIYRYMIPAFGCFWLCFAIISGSEAVTKKFWILVVLLLLFCGYQNYQAFRGEEEMKKVQMVETVAALHQVDSEDIVICNFNHVQAITGYYLDSDSYLWQQAPETLVSDMFGQMSELDQTSEIKQFLEEGKKVWFFGSFQSREDLIGEWEKQGLSFEEKNSCLLERYWFNLYQVTEIK